jgi:hypothetical protein
MRQQPIVLIFLPVIENIKLYYLGYFSVLVLEKNVVMLIEIYCPLLFMLDMQYEQFFMTK